MDPNATHARLREWADKNYPDTTDEEFEAMEAFRNLDGWLTNGGFLPTEWDR